MWVPSVTTILNVLDKAALTNWKIEQHLEQAYHKPSQYIRKDGTGYKFELDEYIAEVKRLTALQMDKAPSAGTDFHKAMEKYVGEDVLEKDHPLFALCVGVYDSIAKRVDAEENYSPLEWNPEVNFVHGSYGGQIDLAIADEWLIDYKTKATAAKFKPGKMAYQDHKMQLAAYRQAIAPNARAANVFVCLEDGQVDFHEHTEQDLEWGWEMFQHALAIWNLQNQP